jgi:hypothetical protein
VSHAGTARENSAQKACFRLKRLALAGGGRDHVLFHDIQEITHFCFLMRKQKYWVFQEVMQIFAAGNLPYGTTDLASLASGKRSSSGQQRQFL